MASTSASSNPCCKSRLLTIAFGCRALSLVSLSAAHVKLGSCNRSPDWTYQIALSVATTIPTWVTCTPPGTLPDGRIKLPAQRGKARENCFGRAEFFRIRLILPAPKSQVAPICTNIGSIQLPYPIHAPVLVKSTNLLDFCTCFHRYNGPTVLSTDDPVGHRSWLPEAGG